MSLIHSFNVFALSICFCLCFYLVFTWFFLFRVFYFRIKRSQTFALVMLFFRFENVISLFVTSISDAALQCYEMLFCIYFLSLRFCCFLRFSTFFRILYFLTDFLFSIFSMLKISESEFDIL